MTNIVTLVGTVTRDPDTRTTQSGDKITSLSVVTSRPKRDKEGRTLKNERGYRMTDDEFHRVTCFNGLGKSVAAHAFKGQKVSVVGRIHYSTFEKDGSARYAVEIIASEVSFLTHRAREEGDTSSPDGDDEVAY